MKRVIRFAASLALVSVSASANAWYWGAPYAYYLYPPYGGYALTQEQQQAAAEQAVKMQQQAIEAQRKFAEQMVAQQDAWVKQYQEQGYAPNMMGPFGPPPPFFRGPSWSSEPSGKDREPATLPKDLKALLEASNARRDQAMEEAKMRREDAQKRMQERREQFGRYPVPERGYRSHGPFERAAAPETKKETAAKPIEANPLPAAPAVAPVPQAAAPLARSPAAPLTAATSPPFVYPAIAPAKSQTILPAGAPTAPLAPVGSSH